MNVRETAAVLAKAQAYDRRTIGEADVLAWHEALSDLDVGDALAAVAAHYRDSTDWLMPVHVRRGVAELARQRRRAELDDAHDREIAAQDRAIAAATRRFSKPAELIAALRATLPSGRPEKVRGAHWLAAHEQRQRRADGPANSAT